MKKLLIILLSAVSSLIASSPVLPGDRYNRNDTKNPWHDSLEDSFAWFFDKNRTKGSGQRIAAIDCLPENTDKNNSNYKEECEPFNHF